MQTPDQSEGNTISAFSTDFPEESSTPAAPQTLELETQKSEERKKMVSSYEDVYTGVPLEPTVNRMSMDASEIDVGDRFDTKQSDSKLSAVGLSSSYEKLYEKQDQSDDEGECKSESTTLSSASGFIDVCSISQPSSIYPTYTNNNHSYPVYITVESGLDKLSNSPDTADTFSEFIGKGSRLKADVVERSMSCDADGGDEERRKHLFRPCSSPDVYSPVDGSTPFIHYDKGTFS